MKKLAFIFLILICTSCGTTKEMRRSSRAAKKLAHLVERFPELQQNDTILTKVSIRTPEISGRIVQPFLMTTYSDPEIIQLPGEPIFVPVEQVPGDPEPFSVNFEDSTLTARFSFDGNQFALEYTVKPIPVDTNIQFISPTIQPVKYVEKELSKFKTLQLLIGEIVFWFLVILACYGVFKLINKLRPI